MANDGTPATTILATWWQRGAMREAGRYAIVALLAGLSLFGIDRWRAVAESGGRAYLRPGAALTLLTGHIVLATLVTAIAALAWLAGRMVGQRRRDGWLGRIAIPSAFLFVLALRPLLWVGTDLSSGAWISEQWFAPLVAIAPASLMFAAMPFAAHIAFGAPAASPRRRHAMTGLLVLAFVVVEAADHRVSTGLYPGFHLFAHTCGVVLAVLVIQRLSFELRPAGRRWMPHVGVLALLVCVAAPFPWFGMDGMTRGALTLRSPMARVWLRHAMPVRANHLLRDTLRDLDVHAGAFRPGATDHERGLIDGRRYNMLFIVVDAMRADAIPPARPPEGLPFVSPEDTPNLNAWLENTYRFRHAYSGATKTFRAMPTMFRSVEVSDDTVNMGVPLARRMEAMGVAPVAVAVDYFFSPKYRSVGALVEGFGDMVFYEKKHNEEAVPATIEMLKSLEDERFFLWLHMYNVHDPGFDGTLLSDADCGRIDCYRRSLRYLDDEFAKLLRALDELGLRENTIVVLLADHGEGLGDHGLMLHGPNVFDEDVRVPLAFEIPGHAGRIIEDTVGLVDVAPTLVDLMGGPVEPQDRGRSLVPLMAGEAMEPRPYYFENMDGKVMGVVRGRDKLIYDAEVEVAYRFDLAADPDEHDDLFDPEGELDRSLFALLIGFNPAIFAAELDDPATMELLSTRLGEVDPDAPGAALPLLVRLVEQRPEDELIARAADIFSETHERAVRLLLLRYLFEPAKKTFSPLLTKWIQKAANRPSELEIVAALAAQGQPEFSAKKMIARLEYYADKGKPETWAPYLRLMRPWSRSVGKYQKALGRMLERAKTEPGVPITILELVLESAASLKRGTTSAEPLAAATRPLLAHDEPRVRAMAARALGGMRSKIDAGTLRMKLADLGEDPRVRRECAIALAHIEGEHAIPALVASATDSSMAVIVVRQLATIGSRKGLPYLQSIADEHYNSYLRREAKKAIARIEAKP